MIRKFKPVLFELILLIIITVPAFLILLNSAYFTMHDDQHIARLFLLDKALNQGILYPRWVDMLGFGYGYPLFNFYPPLIYYVSELFHLIGFSLIWSIKLMLITGFLTGAIGLYYLAKPYIGKATALFASVLYTYFTYHAVVVYVRGAFAEFFAMSLLPILFATMFRLYHKPNYQNSLLFGILFSLLTLCHPLIAFPSLILIAIIFLVLLVTSQTRFKYSLMSVMGGLIGLGLSAFFWLPSIVEKQYTLVDKILTKELATFAIHFLYPIQLWYSPWGYGASIAGPYDGMSFQLGKIHIILALVSTLVFFWYLYLVKKEKLPWQKKFPAINFFLVCFIAMVVSVFLSTFYSKFVWDHVSFLAYMQFPWRFLTFTSVFMAICGAFSIYFITHIFEKLNTKKILFTIVLCLSVVTMHQYQKYFQPQKLVTTTDAERTTFEEIAWNVSRTSYEFVPREVATIKTKLGTTFVKIDKSHIPLQVYSIISGDAKVTVLDNIFNKKTLSITAQSPVQLQLNTYNFPGWVVRDNNNHHTLLINDRNPLHLIRVSIPKGNYVLSFIFENTSVRTVANLISLFTVLLICGYVIRSYYLVSSKR